MIVRNILYLSYDGMTDPLGQSQVIPYLIGLSKLGFVFTLISCEKQHKYESEKELIQKICDENKIDWHPIRYTKKPPILSTMKDVICMLRLAKKLFVEKKIEIVHCRGYITSIVGLKLKRDSNISFLFDMRGFWADEKVDAGTWNLMNPIYRFVYNYFKRKECQFIECADHIIVLTHKGYDIMKKWPCVKNKISKITMIPCCVDIAHFNPSSIDKSLRKKLKINLGISDSDTVLTYLGSIGTWYMLDEMLAFFKVFSQQVPNSKFLFITFDEHERIRDLALEIGLQNNQVLIKAGSRKEIPLLLSLSSYSVFFIRPTFSKLSSSPTKQAEIMAMGIPAFCNAGIGDTEEIINNYHSGMIVKTLNVYGYQEAVKEMKESFFDSEKIREGAISYFSLQKGVESYARVYEKILNS